MAKNFPRTGKKVRPKTAVKGKRFLCAKCRKRSPKPVKTPAPWYCPNCLKLGIDERNWSERRHERTRIRRSEATPTRADSQ